MTISEYSYEFDILYNNTKSQSAPGFDEYEKSVFLTQAQRIFINELIKDGVEKNEYNRRLLEALIVQVALVETTGGNINGANAAISSDTIFFTAPTDLMKITYEVLNITNGGATIDLPIVPIRQDEYHIQKNNPFKKPKAFGLSSIAWRLDYGGEVVSTLEVVPPTGLSLVADVDGNVINSYKVRYIKQPSPIILTDISVIDATLTIEGQTASATCQLNKDAHLTILNIAVELAKKSYVNV
jgi:hypothetical protein